MLEYMAIQEAQEHLKRRESLLKEYRLAPNEMADLGMICGGDVDVMFQYLPPDNHTLAFIDAATDVIAHQSSGWLVLPLDGSGPKIHMTGSGENAPDTLPKGRQGEVHLGGQLVYMEKLVAGGTIYIFGGGHLAQEVVPVLAHIGFRCVVADDRPEYSTHALFPQAEAVYTVDYRHLDGVFNIEPEDYVAIMTRGHLGDTDAQRFAMGTPARYIGVVGSRRKIKTIREKLMAEGFTAADLDRITTPIGLDIGSETPAEIAISMISGVKLPQKLPSASPPSSLAFGRPVMK